MTFVLCSPDSNRFKTKFDEILLMTMKFRNHENLRMQNFADFQTSENLRKRPYGLLLMSIITDDKIVMRFGHIVFLFFLIAWYY